MTIPQVKQNKIENTEIKTIGLIINSYKEQIVQIGRQVITLLREQNVNVLAMGEEAEALALNAVSAETFCNEAQMVLVIGGDGTMLRAARTVYSKEIPILGINQGYLGFLTEVEVEHLDKAIAQLLSGNYQVERRMMLNAAVYRDGVCIADVNALNDMVVTKGALSRIIRTELYLDEELVEQHYGDGLIFSTPTGSTGYSLSAGGPIVYPSIDVCIMAPICSHSLISRPVIFSPEHTLTVRMESVSTPAMLTVDGQNGVELQQGDLIHIRKAEHDTCLLVLEQRNFFAVLQGKLKGTQA
ncbi:MAG: NAD(+)/NADH kinase [Peptococcaceae bacterium]|jgi:NAD+ kinase|nr:NAD(+)/NADH kinase [Peptococcaceae bacterium]MBQ2370131.1 NAD(+)/NADH kinase [Peptococcaceae bacterium]MBQ5369085.1 NAD(+)/NADH kinase [Peptococcaceae bacterium]MBQ5862769.1 NAD(+)/NADH kinase [Peptococcaceae bacterium]